MDNPAGSSNDASAGNGGRPAAPVRMVLRLPQRANLNPGGGNQPLALANWQDLRDAMRRVNAEQDEAANGAIYDAIERFEPYFNLMSPRGRRKAKELVARLKSELR